MSEQDEVHPRPPSRRAAVRAQHLRRSTSQPMNPWLESLIIMSPFWIILILTILGVLR